MAFWVGVSFVYSKEIGASIGWGYFLALTWATSDLIIRATATRSKIRKEAVPEEVNGSKNADAIWLLSSFGPTFYVPIWILGVMTAAGSYALDHYV